MSNNPVAVITMEDKGVIKVELYPEIAKNTVDNFISLATKGFYDGLIFHRVINGFMIQGGDPNGNGMGGADYNIRGEFKSNGFDNNLHHARGVISMARAQNKNSASSQFFIMHQDAPHLDGDYAAFGKVIEGMEEVDKIALTNVDYMDKPKKDQRIKTVTIELNGYEAEEPEKV